MQWSGAVSKPAQAAYEAIVDRMRVELGAEPASDTLLAEYVAKALGDGVSVGSVAFHVSAAVCWTKHNGRGTPKKTAHRSRHARGLGRL